MTRLVRHARREGLSYLFFVGLIATTFLV